jgi:hypothetical protein
MDRMVDVCTSSPETLSDPLLFSDNSLYLLSSSCTFSINVFTTRTNSAVLSVEPSFNLVDNCSFEYILFPYDKSIISQAPAVQAIACDAFVESSFS